MHQTIVDTYFLIDKLKETSFLSIDVLSVKILRSLARDDFVIDGGVNGFPNTPGLG